MNFAIKLLLIIIMAPWAVLHALMFFLLMFALGGDTEAERLFNWIMEVIK